jgi:peptide chain release factor
MLIHISSGNGVDEVCRAIWHFKKWLEKSYEFEVINEQEAKCKNGIKSLLIQSNEKAFFSMQGTLLWKTKSPFRPKHKRKNWYFSLACYEEQYSQVIDKKEILYQTMKSPKKGGQHVNTTCSGVRAVYPLLGVESVAYDERSQHQNKKLARVRLLQKIEFLERKSLDDLMQERWKQSKCIERGDEVLVFEGSLQ